MELRTAVSPRDVKHYTTERLREEFLIQNLFVPGEIKLVYSHIDRIITGAAVPAQFPARVPGSVLLKVLTFPHPAFPVFLFFLLPVESLLLSLMPTYSALDPSSTAVHLETVFLQKQKNPDSTIIHVSPVKIRCIRCRKQYQCRQKFSFCRTQKTMAIYIQSLRIKVHLLIICFIFNGHDPADILHAHRYRCLQSLTVKNGSIFHGLAAEHRSSSIRYSNAPLNSSVCAYVRIP